jgi:hypothetical protein
MEEMTRRAEAAIGSKEETQALLESITHMVPDEKHRLLSVIENIEASITSNERDPNFTIKAAVWRGVLELLVLGLWSPVQVVLRQTTGPSAKREVILRRIDAIKQALRS